MGAEGVLTGSARIIQEAKEKSQQLSLEQEAERKKLELERKRKALEAQIAALQLEFAADEIEALKVIELIEKRFKQLNQNQSDMAQSRKADVELKKKNRL